MNAGRTEALPTSRETDRLAAPDDIRKIYNTAETIKRLSDRLIGVGPWGIGLDGMLAWIPGANVAYGLGAGGLLIALAIKAQARPATIARMAAYIAIDNMTDAVPILGWAADTLFRGHLMAANALQKDIVKRHGPIEPDRPASSDGPRKVGGSSVAGR